MMYTMPGEERFYAKQGARYCIEFSEGEGPPVVFVTPQFKKIQEVVIPGRGVAEGYAYPAPPNGVSFTIFARPNLTNSFYPSWCSRVSDTRRLNMRTDNLE